MRDILDPNRSLEGWLRTHGADDAHIAHVRSDFKAWLEAMRLRQLDPAVRRAQDLSVVRYIAAIPERDRSQAEVALLADLRLRVRGGSGDG